MPTTVPARSASRKIWADFLRSEGIDVPAAANRADLIALWDLNKSAPETDAASPSGNLDFFKPAPNAALADQVPDELRFSTSAGERREPEKVLIQLNGRAVYLYEPPQSLLVLTGVSLRPETPLDRKIGVMLDLLSSCLDSAAEREVRQAMMSRTSLFNDDLLGELVALIFDTWAPNIDTDTTTTKPQNRASRRAAH